MTKYYLVPVYGDVEPVVLGPFGTEEYRDQAAKNFRANGRNQENGIYWLDITKSGKPLMGAYSGTFFERDTA